MNINSVYRARVRDDKINDDYKSSEVVTYKLKKREHEKYKKLPLKEYDNDFKLMQWNTKRGRVNYE